MNLAKHLLKAVAVFVTAWLLGICAWCATIQIAGKHLTDVHFIFTWGTIAYAVTAPTILLPLMLVLRRIVRGYHPAALFAIVGAMWAIVPKLIIVQMAGGTPLDAFKPLYLYHIDAMFIVMGLSVSLGFVLCGIRDNRGPGFPLD